MGSEWGALEDLPYSPGCGFQERQTAVPSRTGVQGGGAETKAGHRRGAPLQPCLRAPNSGQGGTREVTLEREMDGLVPGQCWPPSLQPTLGTKPISCLCGANASPLGSRTPKRAEN